LTRIKGRRAKKELLSPEGFRVAHFPTDVSQLLRLYGTGGVYSTIYERQPNVRTAVDIIAREAGELTLHMFEKVPRSDGLPSGRLPLDDHPMMQLLDEPTPGKPDYDFWYGLFADLCIYERAFWYKIRQNNVVKALIRIPPGHVFPERDPLTQSILSWRGINGIEIPLDDILAFWGYDPESNESSISPLETLRRILQDEANAQMYRDLRWRTGLRKDGIIERDKDSPVMSDTAVQSFLVDVEDSLSGSAGLPLLLQPGMKWQDVSWSPKEMEYLGARQLNRVEVAAAFHIPAAMLMARDKDPDEQTLKFFYKSTLPPWLSRVESTIEAKLLPEFDVIAAVRHRHYVEFNLDQKLRGTPEEQAAIMATAAGGPVITVNEARSRLNLPPIEGGDLIFIPLNSIRAGGPQASPQNPTATPATGIEPAGTTPGAGTTVQSASRQDVLDGRAIAIGGRAQQLVTDPAEIENLLSDFDERDTERKSKESQRAFLRDNRPRLEGRYDTAIRRTFDRQRDIALAGRDLKRERWDKELADDLFGLAYQTVSTFGSMAAAEMKGDWLAERTINYLRTSAEGDAKEINDATVSKLAVEDPDWEEVFGQSRVEQLAGHYVTRWINWAIMEAAHQNGEV
jgi:HK97 family phage portal protein